MPVNIPSAGPNWSSASPAPNWPWAPSPGRQDRQRLLASFLALVAYAQEQPRETVPAQQQPVPLSPMQVQLWIRELRRLGRVVDEVPIFVWLDEPPSGVNCSAGLSLQRVRRGRLGGTA